MIKPDDVNSKTAETLAFVLRNPAIFFSEADIQALFYEKLRELKDFNSLHDTECTIGLNQKKKESDKKYQTYAIHREYGLNNGKSSRVDLAILNPNDISSIVDPINLKDGNNKYLNPDYIFEFGTDKSAKSCKNFYRHLLKDSEKLKFAYKRGFLIHIQRNYLKGKANDANKDKYDQYTEAIKRLNEKLPQSINLLYFKVDLGGPKRIIKKEGKVKIFKNGALKGIGQENINDEIMSLLQ
jgi:hypothetical protein